MRKLVVIVCCLVSLGILSSCNKTIVVETPKLSNPATSTTGYKIYRIEDFLGEGIKNATGTVDSRKGMITISFDYPEQNWITNYGSGCGSFYSYPMLFTLILRDKNDKKLTEVDTKKVYVPESVYNSCKKYWDTVYPSYYSPKPKIITLKSKGNQFTVTVNQSVADYVAKAFMFFPAGNKVMGQENIYKLK